VAPLLSPKIGKVGLCLAQDAVQLGAAGWTDSLGHPGAFFADRDIARGSPFLLALDAVELAAPGFRHDGLLVS
jgi:hypothetical protein